MLKKRNGSFPAGMILLVCFLSMTGCTATNIYTVDMNYDAAYAVIPSYVIPNNRALQSLLTVAEFTDTRKQDDPLIVGRVIEKNKTRTLVLPKHARPTQAVSQGIRHYLRKAGYNVTGVAAPWDLTEENMPEGSGRILIGGNLTDLEINCERGFPTNAYSTKIKLTLYLADTRQKQVLYRSTVEAVTSLEHVAFSEGRMGDQAAIALGDAIEKLFEKRELSQKIKEILSQ
ncbi:MAG: hypothetical protein R6W75_08310 [Smithellaceae bacterium]